VGTLLDAYALIAFLQDEPAAAQVASLISHGDSAISTVNLAEAGQRMLRHHDVTIGELQELVSSMPISVVPFSHAHAWQAGWIRAEYYRRRRIEISLGDSCLLAVAAPVDRVATADPAVLLVAEAEGIATVALPNSGGARS
jgi:PIN domain nuclease of toxin-antitoxin system